MAPSQLNGSWTWWIPSPRPSSPGDHPTSPILGRFPPQNPYLDQGDGGAVEEAEDEEDDEGRRRRPQVVEVVVLLHLRVGVQEGLGQEARAS